MKNLDGWMTGRMTGQMDGKDDYHRTDQGYYILVILDEPRAIPLKSI
jgi:hypothetical protein